MHQHSALYSGALWQALGQLWSESGQHHTFLYLFDTNCSPVDVFAHKEMLDTTGQTLLSCTNTLHSSPDITGHLPRLENCELAMLLLALAWARKHEPGVVWWRLLSYNNILVSVSRMQEVIVYRFVMTGGCGVSGCHNTCHVMSRYVTMCHVANTSTAYIHTFAT